jgi:arsenate reductase-like glutaredoxin family protein
MPFHLKTLRAYLRERGVGRVTVKKRGSPITPEALTAKLKLTGDESRTLIMTRHQGKPIVMICADHTA